MIDDAVGGAGDENLTRLGDASMGGIFAAATEPDASGKLPRSRGVAGRDGSEAEAEADSGASCDEGWGAAKGA